MRNFNYLEGTVCVILSDTPREGGNVRFTMVLLKPKPDK